MRFPGGRRSTRGQKNPLPAWQAGALARCAQVKRLEPCHFSTRYADRGSLLSEEAYMAFRGSDER
jgi:ribonuclease Z